MEIRVGKYRTRGGDVVDVTAIQGRGSWPVDGVLDGDMLDNGNGWKSNGRFYGDADSQEDDRDLVERIEDVVEPGRFEITGPGEYRTRDGRKAVVERVHGYGTWPAEGRIEDGLAACPTSWREAGFVLSEGSITPGDIAGPWIEPVSALTEATNVVREAEGLPPLPTDADVVDAEFVEPDFVEVSAASLRQPGPTIRDVIEHERAETAAFASATEEANRHAFAALRALTRALNRHGIAPGSEVADAHAFALLVIDGFDS